MKSGEGGVPALVADSWAAAFTREHPDLAGHLVWDGPALEALEAAVRRFLRDRAGRGLPGEREVRALLHRLTGLGPLDVLLADDSITEIMINGPAQAYCERQGRLHPVSLHFAGVEDLLALVQRLAARAGRTLNPGSPVCDARLADGSRIHCLVPPVTRFPALTIRRAPLRAPRAEELLAAGTLERPLWEELQDAVRRRANVLIAGGAGTGKTTLLRLLAAAIPEGERVVVIEEVPELRLEVYHRHTVSLEAGERYPVRELVRQALRMRPDRIVVGEVRGEESLDLLEAMATGHPGSLSTVHSRGQGTAALQRLARLAARAAPAWPLPLVEREIRATVDLVIYLARHADGRRLVQEVAMRGPGGWTTRFRRDPAAGGEGPLWG
ncbi:Type II/IV secretion system ATP hydrolase TadA/VirB11/CpaF, TadA subfamily [Candidatus Hydrogenisulfobacillus filiaventi]|uniref:Type II/IV secretion system ATP hydrolase TadA/VirB11/CpaF, TadA subfamily n=1 Tax=Candidatus Hydrogenisulfobacillus filiaventi TaxID=2707344 RepID=A0A6F8ZHQ6_9FIRM|nr:Type II/IV secretion system ATP hydrolase TadA/VirB11/CpaF, TadA subfamily [Candidatus Hydrogenisulfobacillus filiaventi]